jgi:MoaA/NifB/PqqE/SkfB family radical SAM enzyme
MQRIFLKRLLIKKGPPIHLIWFLTAKCNLRCLHCFYHDQISFEKNELSFDEIRKTIECLSPMLSLSLTGGEPFLRDDFSEIVKIIAKQSITDNLLLFTNGYNTENILHKTEDILSGCVNTNIYVGVSIDAYEKEHDEYRNREGSYQRAVQTINDLKKIKKSYRNLEIGINITFHEGNQNIIKELRQFIISNFGMTPSITIIRGHPKEQRLINFNPDIYRDIMQSVEQEIKNTECKNLYQALVRTRQLLGYKLAYDALLSDKRRYDCYAGSLMGVIYETGDVYPCEMLNDLKFGNLREYGYDLNKVWGSEEANKARQWLKKRMCYCTYECQYTCNTLYNIHYIPDYAKGMLRHSITKLKKCGI